MGRADAVIMRKHLAAIATVIVTVLGLGAYAWATNQPADPTVRSEVIETMARIDPAAYRIAAGAVWLADQRERATAIQIPTLVLCGAEDRITPPALSTVLTNLIPCAHCELIERAGHLSNMEQPDKFDALVDAFIRGVDPGA